MLEARCEKRVSARDRRYRAYAGQALLLFLLLVPVFPGVFFRGEVVSPADILFLEEPWAEYRPEGWTRPVNVHMADIPAAFAPWYVATEEALRQGEWPLWNPKQMTGAPLLANYQSAVFYPGRLIHELFDLRWAMTVRILLRLWLCGMTAFWAARVFRLSTPSARFVSVAWMLCGYNQVWANWCLPDGSAWLPVIMAGSERLLRREDRRGFWTLALGGTLILLAGHPESAFAMSLGAGAYFLVRLMTDRHARGHRLRAFLLAGAAWTLALGVATIQILPFLEYVANSSSSYGRASDQGEPSMIWQELVSYFVPRFFGDDSAYNYWGDKDAHRMVTLYVGITTWIAASLLLCRGDGLSLRRRQALVLLFCSILGVTWSLDAFPLTLLNRLPVLGHMLAHYHLLFSLFALCLMGGMGLDHWFSRARTPLHLWPLLVPIGAGALFTFYSYRTHVSLIEAMEMLPYIHRQVGWAALFLTLSLITMGATSAIKARGLGFALMIAMLAVELVIVGRGFNPTLPAEYVYPDTRLMSYLRALPQPARVGFAEANIISGVSTLYALEEVLGYDGIYPERIVRYQRELGTSVWQWMEPLNNITVYLRNPEWARAWPGDYAQGLIHETTIDGILVYRNPHALPRVYLAGEVEVIADTEALFDRMRKGPIDPSKTALLQAPLSEEAALPQGPVRGAVEVVARTSNTFRARVHSEDNGLLVLSEQYYPGWKAFVDGEATEIHPVFYAFRSVYVPKGEHEVEFRYEPRSFRLGLAVSTATLLGSLVAGAMPWARAARGRAAKSTA